MSTTQKHSVYILDDHDIVRYGLEMLVMGCEQLCLVGSAPERPDDRGRFARDLSATIPNLRDGHITMSEPIRINGSPGYETRIDATNTKSNKPVTVVQWLVFGGGTAAMRLIASTPKDEWESAFPRFRAVRDGIRPR